MAKAQDEPLKDASLLNAIDARLSEAAESGAPLELVFAVRGRVERVSGKHRGRWRLRTGHGHVVTFRPEFVIAFNATGQPHRATAPVVPAPG
jgi:hypothetical protein